MSDLRQRAIDLYDAYTHDHHDRRTLLKQMAALAGSVAAAEALIATIAASPAAAAIIDPNDPRLRTEMVKGTEAGQPAAAYHVIPKAGAGKLGAVIVIHENRGLNAHIKDVARRLALEGFRVVAPDLLAPQGGTPADEDKARDMIAAADPELVRAQLQGMMAKAKADPQSSGKIGAVGFCWGGGTVYRLAVAAGDALDAGVSYYGPAPAPDTAAKVQAPLLLHYAGLDTRVAETAEPWVAALKAAGKNVTAYTYPGVNHAFNNDTSAERYDAQAAKLAWGRTVNFLHRHLDADT
jgi:carboxymethylenebutenolidase